MGKSYFKELEQLRDTCFSALKENIPHSTNLFLKKNQTLISIGSGGSYSVALFASQLFRSLGGNSYTLTPLELIQSNIDLTNASILLVTASGKNKDIIHSLKYAIKKEANKIMILCGNIRNKLKDHIMDNENIRLVVYSLPNGKDGFLAMNSIAFFSTIMIRLYYELFEVVVSETDIENIFHEVSVGRKEFKDSRLIYNKYLTYFALYGVNGKPAAYDLESKLTESGIANVQLMDYRNFGHGRHNWINNKPDTTCLIYYITNKDSKLSAKTKKLIPEHIPNVSIFSKLEYPFSMLSLLLQTFYLVGDIALLTEIDPGKPSIPEFGRKLYHLNIPIKREIKKTEIKKLSIRKKISSIHEGISTEKIENLKKAFDQYVEKLSNTAYKGIIFDYDGTLCRKNEIHIGMDKKVVSNLMQLLDSNIMVGIASGRGKSIRHDVQNAFSDEYWDKIVIGYYNGAEIGLASDSLKPNTSQNLNSELKLLLDYFKNRNDPILNLLEIRPKQITIQTKYNDALYEWSKINEIINRHNFKIKAFMSDHSIDIIPKNVSKLNLYDELKIRNDLGPYDVIMCIGDNGKWPGNDFELLSTDYSLSVDSVSTDENTCWNLSPPGYRNVSACMKYFSAFVIDKNKFKFKYSNII